MMSKSTWSEGDQSMSNSPSSRPNQRLMELIVVSIRLFVTEKRIAQGRDGFTYGAEKLLHLHLLQHSLDEDQLASGKVRHDCVSFGFLSMTMSSVWSSPSALTACYGSLQDALTCEKVKPGLDAQRERLKRSVWSRMMIEKWGRWKESENSKVK